MASIVLHHGLFGGEVGIGPVRRNYFKGIDRAITGAGHAAFVSAVHPTARIEKRALQLKRWIASNRQAIGPGRMILVAHSLGGLDARYMLSRLGMGEQVEALITISTPHRGSPYADYWVRHVGRRLRGLETIARLGLDVDGIVDLTTERCAGFNETIIDVPDVRYYSVSAACARNQAPVFARRAWDIVHEAQGPNDCLVSVASAAWGTKLGIWAADHWRTINRRFTAEARKAEGDIAPNYLAMLAEATGSVVSRAAASPPAKP